MSDGVFWPEFKAWLEAHGIDADNCYEVNIHWTPRSVRAPGPICMEVDTWLLNEHGSRYLKAPDEVASETRMVPMRRLPAVEVVRYRQESA